MKGLLRDRRAVAVAAALVVVLVAASVLVARSLGGDEGSGDVAAIKRPPSGTWLGSWVGSRYGQARPQRERAVLELESKLGRKLAIDHTYVPWGTSIGWQPAWDLAQGRIPMISFGNQGDTRQVAAGRHDDYLRSLARQVSALGRPVLLRYGYEMDGDGNRGWVHSGRDYIAAWRHVRRVFDGVQAAWVWAPNASAFADASLVQRYWPGDRYVDWIGADGYNWYGCRNRTDWRSFGQIFQAFYAWGVQRHKPLMVAETGTTEDPADPGRKRTWYTQTAAELRGMPSVHAVMFFDSSKTCPWWVDTTPQALDGFRTLANGAKLAALPPAGK
jgi:hypothetical protein